MTAACLYLSSKFNKISLLGDGASSDKLIHKSMPSKLFILKNLTLVIRLSLITVLIYIVFNIYTNDILAPIAENSVGIQSLICIL